MNPVAIFRFSPTEGPGYFADWLDTHAIPYQIVALDRGENVPGNPREFSGIGMMGGPMYVDDDLPWIRPLLDLVRSAVAADVPVIGHCLGGQLFAKALGARVQRTMTPEIGWIEVSVSDSNASNAWFGGRKAFTTFQWHYDVFDLPKNATRVLTNAYNGEQGYVLGKHIGFQSHIEMTREMVETWCRTGAAELAGEADVGAAVQSEAVIRAGLAARLAALSQVAGDVYSRWAVGLPR